MSPDVRPAKRLRRSTAAPTVDSPTKDSPALPLRDSVSSKNKKEPTTTNKSFARQTRNAVSKPTSATSSPKTSPEKTRKSKKLDLDTSKVRPINNFFEKVSEEQRWRKRSATPEGRYRNGRQDLDAIDDDIMDDDVESLLDASVSSQQSSTRPADKRSGLSRTNSATRGLNLSLPGSSQRFKKPSLPAKPTPFPALPATVRPLAEHAPWAERYGPKAIDELAIHKKKIQDVQRWLADATSGRSHQLLLVLKGAAGTGKSTTVHLLANQMGLNLVEWQNPNTSEYGSLSASAQFADFVSRGAGYGSLSFDAEAGPMPTVENERTVLAVEEFPAAMLRSGSALDSFRSTLLHYCAGVSSLGSFTTLTNSPSRSPIVLIISETLVSSSTALTDSFTAHRLLGAELLNHPQVSVIEFNSVAPTFVLKALDAVIKKEARDSGRRRIPGPAVLQKLAEVGDIRSAVNSLEFLCSRGDGSLEWSGTVAANAKKGSKVSQPLSEMEQNSMKLLSQRESTLDMFHAAGKVVYNKREDPSIAGRPAEPAPKPPDHLMYLHRPKVSQVDVESLLNETGTDIQTFISTVHENYILSCNHDDFVDYLAACSEVMSDAELLDPDARHAARNRARGRASQGTFQAGMTDALRQDEISFEVATRGLLFSLPFPISRATPPSGRKSDSYKMFYPASLRLWKPIEEISALIDLQTQQMVHTTSQGAVLASKNNGISGWKSDTFISARTPDDVEEATLPRIDTSKDTMVLETLPYLAQIHAGQQKTMTTLSKIVHFNGVGASLDTPYDQEEDEIDASFNLTQKVEAAHALLKTTQSQRPHSTAVLNKQSSSVKEEPPIEQLYIEDDDIEDD